MSDKEIEAVFYADIGDIEGLKQASQVIDQEQCESNLTDGTRIRVRREETEGRISYEMTIKKPTLTAGGPAQSSSEYNTSIEKEFYEAFRACSQHVLRKKRYVFLSKSVVMSIRSKEGGLQEIELNNIKYEVDVYRNKEGQIIGFVKIDVELQDLIAQINSKHKGAGDFGVHVKLSHLPFKPTGIISANTDNQEERSKIDSFWEVARLPKA